MKAIYCWVWLLLPSLAYAFNVALAGQWGMAAAILALSFCTLLVPCLWSRSMGTMFLSLLPLALLSPYVAAYSLAYGAPISGGLLQEITQTDTRLEYDEIQRLAWLFYLGSAGTLTFLLAAGRLRATPVPRRTLASATALWAVLFTIYAPYAAVILWMKYDLSVPDEVVRHTYPQNLVLAAIEWAKSESYLPEENRLDLAAAYGHGARGDGGIYVFVVGETARESTWSEVEGAGYFKADGAVRFHDILAGANWSRLAVPLLTRGEEDDEDLARRPSITDWQRWAGCRTAALSNNAGYPFSRGADLKTIVGDDDVVRHNRYDHELLPLLKTLLDKTAGGLCITLHMVGGHQVYTERYDRRFAKFVPASDQLKDIDNAQYRNAIVMSQDFVASAIGLLSRDKRPVFLLFTADHGENLSEINGLRGHPSRTPTEYELQVPGLFWANPQFIEQHAEQWRRLQANAAHPYSAGSMLPTMLDAMGLLAQARQKYEFPPSMMAPYVPHKRWYYSPDLKRHPASDMLRDLAPALVTIRQAG